MNQIFTKKIAAYESRFMEVETIKNKEMGLKSPKSRIILIMGG